MAGTERKKISLKKRAHHQLLKNVRRRILSFPRSASSTTNVGDFPISNYFPSQVRKEKMHSHHGTVMARQLPALATDPGGGNLAGEYIRKVVFKADAAIMVKKMTKLLQRITNSWLKWWPCLLESPHWLAKLRIKIVEKTALSLWQENINLELGGELGGYE